MIIEISVAVIAAAFVILVIYLIVMTKAVRVTLNQTNQTLAEAKKVLEHTGEVSLDVKNKMESLDSVFNTVANIGDILEIKTEEAKEFVEDVAIEQERSYHRRVSQIGDILELAGLGFRLWQKLKRRR